MLVSLVHPHPPGPWAQLGTRRENFVAGWQALAVTRFRRPPDRVPTLAACRVGNDFAVVFLRGARIFGEKEKKGGDTMNSAWQQALPVRS